MEVRGPSLEDSVYCYDYSLSNLDVCGWMTEVGHLVGLFAVITVGNMSFQAVYLPRPHHADVVIARREISPL